VRSLNAEEVGSLTDQQNIRCAWIDTPATGQVSPNSEAATRGPGASTAAGVAVSCLEIASLPALNDVDDTLRLQSLFWEAAWPLLAEATLEFRWVAHHGALRLFVLVGCPGQDREATTAEVERLRDEVVRLLGRVLPGLQCRWLPGAGADLRSMLPFEIAEGGDLVRNGVEIDLGDQSFDVAVPITATSAAKRLLLDLMLDGREGLCISIAAGRTELDHAARVELESALYGLEQHIQRARYAADPHLGFERQESHSHTTTAQAEVAAAVLAQRCTTFHRLGMLRISVASEGVMPPGFVAAARSALGWSAGSLGYVPAAESADLAAFDRNLRRLSFESWGVLRGEHGAGAIGNRYLASLSEVAASAWVPQLHGAHDAQAHLIDPAPLSVPGVVPRNGVIIGENFASAKARPVALSDDDRSRHMYIIGQTGTGKSTLAARMALNDIRAGEGVCVIDPHGDLVDDILLRYPHARAKDLIVFDPRDDEYPLGLNLFETRNEAERDFAIQQVISMLYRLYDPHRDGIIGPRFEHMLRSAALTVMSDPAGGTFLDIPLLFTSDKVRQAKIKHVTDPVVKSFWLDEQANLADFHKSEVLGWFVAKWGAFLANSTMRRILGQRWSGFDFRDVMDSRKVLLVKLAKGQIGEINARILGMILVSKLQMAALGRADMLREQRTRFHLYVDEFQSLALSTFDELVAEARKYGLALTLMNQHVRQLPEAQRMALFGNVGTLCAFRLGLPDATLVAEEFEGLSVRDLTRLENYRCAVRMAVAGRVQTPFDINTLPLEVPESDAAVAARRLFELSRKTWGTPAERAEAEALRIFDGADGMFRLPL